MGVAAPEDPSTLADSAIAGSPEQLFAYGLEHHRAGRLSDAEALYRRVLLGQPQHADCLHRLGRIALECGEFGSAAASIRQAIGIDPHHPSYHADLGDVLQRQGLLQEAAACYLHALVLRPDLAAVHVELAKILLSAGQLEQAILWYQRGLALDPDLAVAYHQLGDKLRQPMRLEDAITSGDRAAGPAPEDADAYHWAGRVLREMGYLDRALERFRRAQEIDPRHPRAGFGEAMVLLLQGRYDEGWRSYERRWQSSDHFTPMRTYDRPTWQGDHLESGSVFLWPEQGLGDEILFAGLIPDVMRTGSQCVLACDARLQPLLARSFPGTTVLADVPPAAGEAVSLAPGIVAQLPIGSLPGLFRRSPEAFRSAQSPYLVADPVKRNTLRGRYADGRRLVGLSWFSRNAETGASRSIDLTALASLFSLSSNHWVSLQYGPHDGIEQAAATAKLPLLVDPGIDQLTDVDGFAAQVAAMDLVVTIDNTTAHLAGALGVPVWLLLPFGPDWRWQLRGDRSPWYPSMRLFRQTRRGDWNPVVGRVRDALLQLPKTLLDHLELHHS